MYTFKELKKASALPVDGKEIRLALLGNVSTQLLATSVKGYAKKENINLNLYDADYNQIDSQLIDVNSEVYFFQPDFILLYIATEKIYEEFLDMPINRREEFADVYIEKIKDYWDKINNNLKCKILHFGFVELDDRAFGNYGSKVKISFIYQMRKLVYKLQEAANLYNNVYPMELSYLQNRYGRNYMFSSEMYYTAKMTLTFDILPYVAKQIIDIINVIQGRIKKCVVLDLDNTLWGGVIGDDGIGNIEIGELGRGHAFTNFQKWLKQLKDRGILLAVCSKNEESTAKEPFEKHNEMILRLDDISAFVANWRDKATNINYIREILNIGMDSFVFIDDNIFERNLVKESIKEIDVPNLPEDPAGYLEFIQEQNYFETVTYSEEDRERTSQYKQEFDRREMQVKFASIDDFLLELNMQAEAKQFDEFHYSRIAQLTQRSNQFNLRTIRYTEDDIKRISNTENYFTLYFTLRDKLGDHGLISVIILEKKDDRTLFIDTWLMSCRVLKRGMEEFIVNKIVDLANENDYNTIVGEYIPTMKNMMVKDIYERMGFHELEENIYKLEIEKFEKLKTFIS